MKTRIVATVLLLVAGTVCGTPDFVIVSPPDLRAAWEVYAVRRHAARPDLDIAVTGTDAIYAAHPFGPGLPCRNAAESVHAYIREAAQVGAVQRLTNRIALASATLAVDAETSVVFGMRDGTGLHPFRLDIDGACALVPATAEASAGLVGTTWVELAEDAELALDLPLYDADAGGIVFSGPGMANASVRALAGTVEVRDGAELVLETVPLPAVTALVVRAGATLRIPSDATGLYAVLASSCPLPACWEGRFTTPGGQSAELVFAADRTILCVRVHRLGTVMILR